MGERLSWHLSKLSRCSLVFSVLVRDCGVCVCVCVCEGGRVCVPSSTYGLGKYFHSLAK